LRVLTLLSEGESNTTITRYCKCDGRLSGVVDLVHVRMSFVRNSELTGTGTLKKKSDIF